jgi:hypothetical protein
MGATKFHNSMGLYGLLQGWLYLTFCGSCCCSTHFSEEVSKHLFYYVRSEFSQPWLWRLPPSGMSRRVYLMWADVSEKFIASIFRVENPRARNQREQVVADLATSGKLFDWWLSLQPPAHAGSLLADSSTLKMEATRPSETLVHTRTTRRHIPEEGILH